MNERLSTVINYINDNFRYGSKIESGQVDALLRRYTIGNEEKELVYDELESLNIETIYSNEKVKYKLERLLKLIGNRKEIEQDKLKRWFQEENVDNYLQETLMEKLHKNGFTVLKESLKEFEHNFDFLDDLELEDLDLDDPEFMREVEELKDVIDKRYNNDYIQEIQSEDIIKKTEGLDKIVEANQKLVWKCVMKYKHFSTAALDVNDMYQAGIQGLLKAVEKFDLSLGNQLSTYASWYIIQSIQREIANNSTTIRIPVHMREKIMKWNKYEKEYFDKHEKKPSSDELAGFIGVSITEVNDYYLYQIVGNLASLDSPISDSGDSFLGDFILDENEMTPEETMMKRELSIVFSDIMNKVLTEREKEIITLRFGLIDGELCTLEEIGNIKGVTRERIRQIEAKALEKMRNPKYLAILKEFLDGY